MAEMREPVRVAVNVMRARLTILGFNLAIITFQLNQMRMLDGGITLPGIDFPVHITAAASLFLAFALSIVAMVSFVASGDFDSAGTCDHWSLLLGDLLMYLALAQTVAGFFGPFLFTLGQVALGELDEARDFGHIHTAVTVAGGTAWFAAHYLGPVISLARSPFSRRATVTLAGVYVLLALLIAWVGTTAWRMQSQRLGLDGPDPMWLGGLYAPLYW